MSTGLAIVPQPPVIEFRRCTGDCCDPITLPYDPGYFIRRSVIEGGGDVKWIAENLVYLGWCPPSQGGWIEHGVHEYRCPHFAKQVRKCLIYGTGKRTLMCRAHPDYGRGPWEVCDHDQVVPPGIWHERQSSPFAMVRRRNGTTSPSWASWQVPHSILPFSKGRPVKSGLARFPSAAAST